METFKIPGKVLNIINGEERDSSSKKYLKKINPHNGELICELVLSQKADIDLAVDCAKTAQVKWAATTPVRRGEILFDFVAKLKEFKNEIAKIVALETGKSFKEALGETNGAIALGTFFAGEGQRLYGKTTTSGTADKYAIIVREPVGIAGLITAANTPIANVAWKVFPALICGNSVILKSAECTPLTSWIFGKIANMTEIPAGVFNIIQGLGIGAGTAIVEHPDINLISFTGSSEVGKYILKASAERIAKVSLELGGKNPLVVCDDADLENAARWILLSAFSNAGQRCASGSRIIIFESIYDEFCEMLVEKTKLLKVGPNDDDDFGPVINEHQLNKMLVAIQRAKECGAKVLTGGNRLTDEKHKNGFYLAPTIIENVATDDEISTNEIFGPITCLYKVKDFSEALALANNSPYGLTACIHTKNVDRATEFTRKVQSGVAVVNGGTYGSEPHMPFGGVKLSGNGTREPGIEALDIYSNTKVIYQFVDTKKL